MNDINCSLPSYDCINFNTFHKRCVHVERNAIMVYPMHALLKVHFDTAVLSSSEFYIDWKEASRQCKTKYDSELITFDYIKTENLSSEIISDLGNNISAWIDGKVRLLGCTDGEGLYVIVNWLGKRITIENIFLRYLIKARFLQNVIG